MHIFLQQGKLEEEKARTPNPSIKAELGDTWEAKFKIDAGGSKRRNSSLGKSVSTFILLLHS